MTSDFRARSQAEKSVSSLLDKRIICHFEASPRTPCPDSIPEHDPESRTVTLLLSQARIQAGKGFIHITKEILCRDVVMVETSDCISRIFQTALGLWPQKLVSARNHRSSPIPLLPTSTSVARKYSEEELWILVLLAMVQMGRYCPFIRPQSPATRDTAFDVEGVPAKLRLLHNIFDAGSVRMYDDKPGCHDEFGPFTVLKNGKLSNGDKYVKTDYIGTFPNTNTYYYLNHDGSFYVMNPDGSEFYRHPDGSEWYVPPPPVPEPEVKVEPEPEVDEQVLNDLLKLEVKEEETLVF
ncbi:hypothetical protein SCHPADRAFT_946683 [Schizopora paradoxa]|uniref:Uncharacterized protein n=1 Tax=Schizopora paradoxa TaxID=27342 RepID=A0A0H2R874_9AGAM|nr:hypothetical protein SCHPADRAFT_946683 [Schizopora paradoxa]